MKEIREPEITDVPWVEAVYDPNVVWRTGVKRVFYDNDTPYIHSRTSCLYVFASEQAARVDLAKFGTEGAPYPLTIGESKYAARELGWKWVSVIDEEGVEVVCYEVSA